MVYWGINLTLPLYGPKRHYNSQVILNIFNSFTSQFSQSLLLSLLKQAVISLVFISTCILHLLRQYMTNHVYVLLLRCTNLKLSFYSIRILICVKNHEIHKSVLGKSSYRFYFNFFMSTVCQHDKREDELPIPIF